MLQCCECANPASHFSFVCFYISANLLCHNVVHHILYWLWQISGTTPIAAVNLLQCIWICRCSMPKWKSAGKSCIILRGVEGKCESRDRSSPVGASFTLRNTSQAVRSVKRDIFLSRCTVAFSTMSCSYAPYITRLEGSHKCWKFPEWSYPISI